MLNMIESGERSKMGLNIMMNCKKGSIGLANPKRNHTIDVLDKKVDHLIKGGV